MSIGETSEDKTAAAGAKDGPGHEAELRARIAELVSPGVPLAPGVLNGLLEEALASGDPELCRDLVMTVHGRGALRPAREMALRCVERFPDSERMKHVAALMAPPRVVPSPPITRIDRRPDYDWLEQHAHEYPGEWLVLCRGRLWGHASSLAEAKEHAQRAGLAERPFLYQVAG